jgi:hypothetical protein
VLELMDAFNRTDRDIEYKLDGNWRITEGDVSLTVHPTFSHAWNPDGGFDVQVSFRERPTLDVVNGLQLEQSYFPKLPFAPLQVPCLDQIEVLSEKIRAAYQRAKVRDVHDLFVFSTRPWNRPLLRRLVVIKLWQVHDPFDPVRLFERLSTSTYDWEDLRRLLRNSGEINGAAIIRQCINGCAFLSDLTEQERALAADAKGQKQRELHAQLVESCRSGTL